MSAGQLISELLAIVITLLVGPLTFYLLTFKYRGKPSFPVGEMDKYGDIVLLPAFNALAVHYGVLGVRSPLVITIALGIAYVSTRIFVIWRKDFAKHNDWTRPKRGSFNAAGWYHVVFMFVQIFVICMALISFYDKIWLWLPAIGFLLLAGIRFRALTASTP